MSEKTELRVIDMDPKLIDVPMPIETDRLIIRPYVDEDASALCSGIDKTWDALHYWMPWAKDRAEETNPENKLKLIRQKTADFATRADFMLGAFAQDDGRFIAGTGLHRMDWAARSFEIGYWVRQGEQGKGYATELTNALIRYAIAVFHAVRVEINHADGNDASRKVIEKLGFEKECVRRHATALPDGRIVDSHQYIRFNIDGLPPLKVRWRPR